MTSSEDNYYPVIYTTTNDAGLSVTLPPAPTPFARLRDFLMTTRASSSNGRIDEKADPLLKDVETLIQQYSRLRKAVELIAEGTSPVKPQQAAFDVLNDIDKIR